MKTKLLLVLFLIFAAIGLVQNGQPNGSLSIDVYYPNNSAVYRLPVTGLKIDLTGATPVLSFSAADAFTTDPADCAAAGLANSGHASAIAANGNLTCTALVPRYASAAVLARATNITATTMQFAGAVVPAGIYRVVVYTKTQAAGSGGTLAVTIAWNDGTARSVAVVAALDLTSATAFSGPAPLIIRTDGVNDVTYAAAISGGTGSPAFDLHVVLERLL